MKKRRFLSLIVAMLMVMSTCMPALADTTSTTGITYDDMNNNIVTSSGTVTISDIPATALRSDGMGGTQAGVDFSTYQIIYATYDSDNNTITYHLTTWAYSALVDATNPTPAGKFATEQAAIDAIQASMAIGGTSQTTGQVATEQTEVLNTLAAYIADNSGNEYSETFTYSSLGNNATATLPVGVYLVIPSAENMAFLNMMVSVNAGRSTATNLQDNQWTITTVGATLKGNVVGITKTVEDCEITQSTQSTASKTAEVQVGDKVTYTLVFNVPKFALSASNVEFTIVDTPTNLQIDASTVVVKGLASGQTWSDGTQLYAYDSGNTPVAYTVDWNGTNTGALTIDFSDYYFNVFCTTSGTYPYETVMIQYEATVLSTAVTGTDGNPNEVVLTYGHDGDSNTAKSKSIVYTYKAVLTKYDEATTALYGAGFKIYPSDGAGGYSTTALQFIDNNDGTYTVYDGTSSIAGSTVDTIYTYTDGTLTIFGLDANVSYKIEETVAPSGYTLNTDYLTFIINGSQGSITSDPTYQEYTSAGGSPSATSWTAGYNGTDNYLTLSLTDTKLAAMPAAGGVGIIVFTVLGVCLMIVAVFLLTSKDSKKKQAQ